MRGTASGRRVRHLEAWLGLGGALSLAALAGFAGSCGGAESSTGTTSGSTSMMDEASGTTASTSIALTKDDSALWVVNQDSDSVSVIDTKTRALLAEIPLGSAPPAVDPTTKRYDPQVTPRALAIVNDKKVYVVGESANRVFVLDADKHTVLTSIPVPAAPSGVAAAPDGSAVYVVSHEAAQVTEIDPKTDKVVKSLPLSEHPWSISVSADGKLLFVTHLLLDPGVSVIDAATLTLKNKVPLADQPQGSDPAIPNGVARGLYAVVPSPTTGELWIPHLLLATKTAQPTLKFDTTVFPTVSTLAADGSAEGRRLLFQPMGLGFKGSFAESVSGPHAVSFTPDGKFALVAFGQSEDVMIFDTTSGDNVMLLRPLKDDAGTEAAMLEGIVVDHTGKHAYVDGRNTHNVAVLSIDEADSLSPLAVDGAMIDRIKTDPMASLRQGQRMFYTANSKFKITQNFWVACASCHIEGGSDAVTWLFKEGPRDTPSNAGGPINTGFLLHQALRSNVDQYDATIHDEQGGSYKLINADDKVVLDALADYVNYAIPFPQNPNLAADGTLTDSQKRGAMTFQSACTLCHTGAYLTDSGNATMDFSALPNLHDVGTCVKTGPFPDKVGETYVTGALYGEQDGGTQDGGTQDGGTQDGGTQDGGTQGGGTQRDPCQFDTPTLRGVFATPPYFHDGSARTLRDVVDRLPASSGLSDSDKDDLVAYVMTL